MELPGWIYESKPYGLAIIGLEAMRLEAFWLGFFSGAILMAASAVILKMRHDYKSKQAK